jgi:hypothetical protein
MYLKTLQPANKEAENVHEVAVPYGLIGESNLGQRGNKQVIFWGASFLKLSDQLKIEEYVKITNMCLDYIRKQCVGYELFYKPHPAEKKELKLLDLKLFRILDDSKPAEIFIWKNLGKIAYSFSISSNASISAYSFGLNSYVFYKLFENAVGRATFEAWCDYFKNCPERISIHDLSKPLADNKEIPTVNDLLEQNMKKLLEENNGEIWFTIVEPSPVMIMVAIAKLIKNISPGRPINLVISQQHRWRAIDTNFLNDYFDDIKFLPRVYYSLKPERLLEAVRQAFKIQKLKIGSRDIIISFMAFPNFSFVENCLVSYFGENKKVTFCYPANFNLMYALEFSGFFAQLKFKTKLASVFFNRVLEPCLGLYRTLYLQCDDGKIFNITRYEKPIHDIFDQVYLTQ